MHWYGIMYLIGFVAGWWLARRRAKQPGSTWKPVDVDDLIFFAALGVILGGRIGYVLVYGHDAARRESARDPFKIWEGGMSFHGGLVGVMIAIALFARAAQPARSRTCSISRRRLPGIGLLCRTHRQLHQRRAVGQDHGRALGLPRRTARCATPRSSTKPSSKDWCCSSCCGGSPRSRGPRLAPSGLFLVLYGMFRFAVEFVRVPDDYMGDIGYLAFGWLTTGQLLSLPMILVGVAHAGVGLSHAGCLPATSPGRHLT